LLYSLGLLPVAKDKIAISILLLFQIRLSSKKYFSLSIGELSKGFEKLKFVEKVIQEIVDWGVDINQCTAENLSNRWIMNNKDSFWKIRSLIKTDDQYVRRLIDTVSFRNGIVYPPMMQRLRSCGREEISLAFIDIYRCLG